MSWEVNIMPENKTSNGLKTTVDQLKEEFPRVRRQVVYLLITNSIKMRADEHKVEPALVTQALIHMMKRDTTSSPTNFQIIWNRYKLAELFSDNNEFQSKYNSLNRNAKGKVDVAVENMMAQTMDIADTVASQETPGLLRRTSDESGFTIEEIVEELNSRNSKKS